MACNNCLIPKFILSILCLIILSAYTRHDIKNDTTTIGMFTPHVFDSLGETEMKFSMVLDKIGRRTAYKQFNKKGEKKSEANVVFNPDGFIEAKDEVNEMSEKNVWQFEYKYDQNGNWTQGIANNNKQQIIIARTYEYYSAE